jgi:hypothetical protein
MGVNTTQVVVQVVVVAVVVSRLAAAVQALRGKALTARLQSIPIHQVLVVERGPQGL